MEFGPGFLVTFLYYFASTAVIFTLVMARGVGVGTETGIPQLVGLVGGLVAGLVGGSFNRTATLSVEFKNQKQFVSELEQVLNQLGYAKTSEMEDVWVYERSSFSRLFSGKVYVQIEQRTATIASRASNISQVRKAMPAAVKSSG